MFYQCHSLKNVNLSSFDTNKVTGMYYMFSDCKALNDLNLSNFVINNKTNIKNMFKGCSDKLINKVKKYIKIINI